MNPRPNSGVPGDEAVAAAAAAWVMRLDRGLTPDEQDQYLQWLAENPEHVAAIQAQRRVWDDFDRLAGLQSAVEAAPNPDLLAPEPSRRRAWAGRRAWSAVAILGGVAAAWIVFRPEAGPPAPVDAPLSTLAAEVARLAPIQERVLEDGSLVRLNRGAEIEVVSVPGERRIRLLRGEAAFTVAPDASRPFIVLTDSVAVRAIGTVFNVRREAGVVDVIVVEGRVVVGATGATGAPPLVEAGQRAIVPLVPSGEPTVVSPPPEELSRRLAWQPRTLAFTDEPLAVILNEFNRHNPVLLRIDDPALQHLRLTARFRSDNVPAFLRLLTAEFGVAAHPQPGGELALRYAR